MCVKCGLSDCLCNDNRTTRQITIKVATGDEWIAEDSFIKHFKEHFDSWFEHHGCDITFQNNERKEG